MRISENPAGLYVHIPFCKRLCLYCDFYSKLANTGEIHKCIAAIGKEAAGRDDFADFSFDTVFLGGGTPSILNPEQITDLFRNLRHSLEITPDAEITIECNPSTLDINRLAAYKDCGINRVSLGVQSFNDGHLKTLGRLHDSGGAIEAFEMIRKAGFDNVSIDLIYGLPSQSLNEWKADLEKAIELSPEHISAYNLIIESATPFGRMYADGELLLPSEEAQDTMYEILNTEFDKSGLSRYEISNFARRGRECRHNLKYWHLQPYLGLGPAAVSYIGTTRRKNKEDIDEYLAASAANVASPHEIESLTSLALRNEAIMMGLRLSEGLSVLELRQRFDYDICNEKRDILEILMRAGYLTFHEDRICLTPQSLFISDEVILKLL
jgi:oxygen-independent coproporphyrinogen III oxidase